MGFIDWFMGYALVWVLAGLVAVGLSVLAYAVWLMMTKGR